MANTISNNLENPINRTMLPQTNLVCQIYYDLDWVNRKFAVEWWQNNGHFNDELYDKVLQEKLNRIKDPSPDVVFLNSNQIR